MGLLLEDEEEDEYSEEAKAFREHAAQVFYVGLERQLYHQVCFFINNRLVLCGSSVH